MQFYILDLRSVGFRFVIPLLEKVEQKNPKKYLLFTLL